MVLIVINFAHVVVDFTPLIGRNVCCWIFSFMYKLLEQGVDLTVEALSIERALHTDDGFHFVEAWVGWLILRIIPGNFYK